MHEHAQENDSVHEAVHSDRRTKAECDTHSQHMNSSVLGLVTLDHMDQWISYND